MKHHGCALTAAAALAVTLLVAAGDAQASLAVHPAAVSDTIRAGEIGTTILHITNRGPANPLNYTVTEAASWLSAYPTSGSIPVGDTVAVTLTSNATSLAPGTYTTTVTVVDPHHGPIAVPMNLLVQVTTGVETTSSDLPAGARLEQNLPNPAAETTMIAFVLASRVPVALTMYDATGRIVARPLGQQELEPGRYEVSLGTSGMPVGVYFYRLEGPDIRLARRLVVSR